MIQIVSRDLLKALAATVAATEAPKINGSRQNGFSHRLDVPRWLRSHGVAFREKSAPDCHGRTVYVLDSCPFDPSHGASHEVAIYQAADGQLGAACKHNSCAGKGWHDFKEAIGRPDGDHYDPPLTGTKKNGSTTPKVFSRLEAGTLVKALDRGGNFGTIVSDHGDGCTVHFVSAEGQAADVYIHKTQLCLADGRPLTEASEPPRFTKIYSCQEFLALDLRAQFLVRDVLAAGQPCVIGGLSKTLKTSVACDLVVSLGSGTPFLGRFHTERATVGFWSGETGGAVLRETALRIAKNKGVDLAQCEIFWGFDLPKLSVADHLAALRRIIEERHLRVVVVDPLYLSLLSAETASAAGNLFAMGAALQPLTEIAQATGSTLVTLHHFRKSAASKPQTDEPCGLEELSQSGIAEWARQWILLQRRSTYQNDGHHSLWMRAGGSAGHSGLYSLNIQEGTLDTATMTGRKWEVEVSDAHDAIAEIQKDKDRQKAKKTEERESDYRRRALEALKRFGGEGETSRVLKTTAGLNSASWGTAIRALMQEGRAETCELLKRGRREEGYRYVEV